MNELQQEILGRLQKAAEGDQGELYWENIKKLLPDVSQTDILNIIVRQVRQFLSDFSRAHPDDEEIHRAIEAFNNITSLETLSEQGRLIDPILNKYWDWPGVSSFRNIFKGIERPWQYFEHSGDFLDTVVSILSRLLIAIEANAYWGSDPEFRKTFFGSDIQKAVFMLAKNYSDPKMVELRKSGMIELAREIERALQSG